MPQLLADCLNDIFEYLEEDGVTLHSCLFVNRLWCEVSVRIFWRNIRNINTLIACLPNESKEILYKSDIIAPTLTSKSPIFNYATFCKNLSINRIIIMADKLASEDKQHILFRSFDDNTYIIAQEVLKLLMRQASLRVLNISHSMSSLTIIKFVSYAGVKDCLKNLTELYCTSGDYDNIHNDFLYRLSQICHNLQTLRVLFSFTLNGLTDLISVQKNLRYLKITRGFGYSLKEDMITSLTKLSNTLTRICITWQRSSITLSFLAKFTHLKEITLYVCHQDHFRDFNTLQYVTFPQLQILRFKSKYPKPELLGFFLKNNGKSLREFYVDHSEDSLNLAIAEFCPNLRKISIGCEVDKLETLKEIFNRCQYLESIKIWVGSCLMSENDLLEVVAKYSSRDVHELKLYYGINIEPKLFSEKLESFFISWTNRIPRKSLSFIISCRNGVSLAENYEIKQIIEKYIKLGVIKEFEITDKVL